MKSSCPETVFGKGVSWSPKPEKSRVKVNKKVGGITAFGGARQGRVCQSWKCELLLERELERS